MDNLVLERTARSVCNQDSNGFKLIIVYTDKPEINYEHENLNYLHFPYEEVTVAQITDWEDRKQWYSPVFAERMMDKSRKIILGCQMAKSLGCTYLMGVDSDDLVSSKLASFISNYPEKNVPGWRIVKGFVYEENEVLAIKNKNIWQMNGSTHIIRADLVKIPDFTSNFNLFDYSLFQSHVYTYQRLIDFEKEKLEEVPFYAVIYLIHSNNYSEVKNIISANSIKLLLKKILFGKLITQKLREEFGLYSLKNRQVNY
ncbi:MAG: hypothetical protein KGM16_11920 [Bacteroidota bacterium]|nr:hypothetical protein [Bacteroidota bacterium]